jgi:transcriptional regulator NrdR family protein
MKHVIKSTGKVQIYSSTKLQKSIARSLLAVHVAEEDVADITSKVSTAVMAWLDNKYEVSTVDIRTIASRELAKYSKDAAVVYKKHKELW